MEDAMDQSKNIEVELWQYQHERQREQQRAAQQRDEDQYAAAVDTGTYSGTYSQWRGEN